MMRDRITRAVLTAAMAASVLVTGGCVMARSRLVAPAVLVSPYDSVEGDVIWAIAPLRNASGVSFADTQGMTEAIAAEVTATRGLAAAPIEATLRAMAALGMADGLASAEDARQLAGAMGVDAVLVGTLTAYDPYEPTKLGVSLALFARAGLGSASTGWGDPRVLASAATEQPGWGGGGGGGSETVVVDYLDGANHEVQMAVQRYAAGRHELGSALGWRRYIASMREFERFAAYWSVSRLLEQERLRISRSVLMDQ